MPVPPLVAAAHASSFQPETADAIRRAPDYIGVEDFRYFAVLSRFSNHCALT